MFKILPTLLLSSLAAMPALADMAYIPADRDTTLIEDASGATSNGFGPSIFAGHTNQSMYGIRRALLRFDVASALPEDAIIDKVYLSLYQSSGNAEPGDFNLHRVLGDWGEGASFATGGGGAAAEDGDATWLHSFYDYDYWVHQGGHFVPHASSTATVGGKDFHTWQSTNHMVNNVRHWLHDPERNFGWLVMGDEDTRGSVKRFSSRESGNSDQQPMLIVEYHLPGTK